MGDSAYRQILMLRKVPRSPQAISTRSIHQYLTSQENFDISLRSVQRDMNTLSTLFPLISHNEGREVFWSFMKDGVVDIPAMDMDTAIAFDMVDRFLKDLLPPSALENLQPHIEVARRKLQASRMNRQAGNWSDKVQVLSRGMPLIPAVVDPKVLKIVYESLYKEKRLAIERYENKREEISPLGIVHRGSVTYLVCTFWGYKDVRQVALHRIQQAELVDEKALSPVGFDLQRYVDEQHEFQIKLSEEKIRLQARFYDGSGKHLLETPLSGDQQVEMEDDNAVLLTATVDDTLESRWWLMSFGENVEVLGDDALVEWMGTQATSMVEYYQ